jgi:hypothetical protein
MLSYYLDAAQDYVARILASKSPLLDEAVAFVRDAAAKGLRGNEALGLAKAQGINPTFLYAALARLNPEVYSGENGEMVLKYIMAQYGHEQRIPGGELAPSA